MTRTVPDPLRWLLLSLFGMAMLGLLVLLLAAPALAADSVPAEPRSFVFPTDQVWALVAGGLAPLVAYVLNHYSPFWFTEPVKGIVQAVAAAVAAGIAQAITAGDVGFNDATLQFVVTGVVGALLAHIGYAKAHINVLLGGGSNHKEPAT